jgi:thiol:disulfide interchange protein DsbD
MATVSLEVATTWHINANPASPEYMIKTVVELAPKAGVSAGPAKYPSGRLLKLDFEDSEVSVYDGTVVILVPLSATAQAVNGAHTLQGKLRFQACNDQLCTPPATVPFTLAVAVTGGVAQDAAAGAPPVADSSAAANAPTDTVPTAPVADRFATAPPASGSGAPDPLHRVLSFIRNPEALARALTRELDRGGPLAFLLLFLIGLALNLTPCVYPMLGVTVSIFGARKAAPPLQVFGLALLYVLGMAAMYSTLGLIAALTGGLFGAALQSPLVRIGIGLLLMGMSLSMFGVYEIQMPAALRERASAVKAAGALGVFLSGLVVGVFAAPCIGAPVVALLTFVGAKGDPLFGFTSFFTLALGLGAPYLVLGTFSNLLQTLPRSGDWMEWVKKLFGVIMLAIGAFYAMLGIAPGLAGWVVPVALVAGGAYLGFIDRHADQRPVFRVLKRVGGAVAVLGGLAIVATTPRQVLTMTDFTPQGLEAALRDGKVAMVDFSADWCVPCHELERYTFTDARVIDAARGFATFRADLTRFDSPESDTWRKQYVPTVLFITPDGKEVRAARVEGFLPANEFLRRMDDAANVARRSGRVEHDPPGYSNSPRSMMLATVK